MKQKESLAVLQESAEAGRLSRGCLLVESVKALADGNGCSVSGYEIKLHGPTEQLRCTCADFIYRGLQCKHILATKMWLNGLPSSASGVESAAPPLQLVAGQSLLFSTGLSQLKKYRLQFQRAKQLLVLRV